MPSIRLPALVAASVVFALSASAQDPTYDERLEQLLERLTAVSERLDDVVDRLVPDSATTATDAATRLAWYADHLRMVRRSRFDDLEWQFLGPTNMSGRITDLAVATPRGLTYTIYAAAASGGLWKTVNEGTTWESVFEQGPSMSIGDVTIAPSDEDIVWIGTGEANIFRSSMAGTGVYKSTDAGETWEHMGLASTFTIARIVIHPDDPDLVYVAASGHEWTDNEERGVYRTTDGGESWEKVLFVSERTGAIDLVMDPTKPSILYAATWERRRKRWNDPRAEPDHTESSIYRSTDGGDSWEPITDGLPAPEHRGRIGIDLARSNPSVVYAFIDCYEVAEVPEDETDSYDRRREEAIEGARLYRSDDRGESWRMVSESDDFMRRMSATYGWVFGQMRVDPTDEDTVYLMGLALNVSNDAGATFRRLRGMHGDHHALWIDPENPDYLVNGNDGGLVISYDGGENWRNFNDNLPIVQFYNVSYDMDEPFHVYGSIQDHGSRRGVVDISRGRDRIRAVEWERAPGGEASYHAIDPTDPNTVYSEGFYGRISRRDLETGERKRIAPSAGEDEEPLRGQWLAPFIISPHNPRILYHGMNRLYRSMDRGENFEPISPDLTRNLQAELGDISFQTITAISESPLRFGLIYAGTDDGRLHVTRDSGGSWTEIVDGLAPERWFSRVEASRYKEGTVYATQNGKRHDDFTPYVWRSRDYGSTWRSIANGIPSGPVNVIREDPRNEDVLYVGTDLGVYVSTDRGGTWDVLAHELPTTYVHDLIVHPRDDVLVIATHGRGMWALDVRPIQDPDSVVAEEEEEEAEAEAAEPEESAEEESAEEEESESEEDVGEETRTRRRRDRRADRTDDL